MPDNALPETGFLRLRHVIAPKGPIPVSKSTWWAGIKDGRYPKPVKLGPRITAWRVAATLTREFDGGAIPTEVSRRMLNRFQLAMRGRGTDMNGNNDNEVWAFGQHFGLATPLLDWTESPFVALFFAFAQEDDPAEKSNESRAVFTLNRGLIEDLLPELFFEPVLGENARLVNQAGLFTVTPSGDDNLVSAIIEAVIDSGAVDPDDPKQIARYIYKVHIPNQGRLACLSMLRRMNIHHANLFPDPSGASEYCTPVEGADRNTPAIFGDYIDIYDISRAVEDGATVPIYYESRLARIELDEDEKPKIDAEIEALVEDDTLTEAEKFKAKWATVEALVGAEKRLRLIAADLVTHLEARLKALDGKAMAVCMSRRICVELYDEIVKLRPEWHSDDDAADAVKIVMTGAASDPLNWQQHIGNKRRRDLIAKRARDPNDPLKLVIVRDMWLTGFDAPSMNTMYVDKPMRGHGLMQAIARVNRVFRDKPGGLIVDYIGILQNLKNALKD